jgi:beta-glucanase (GH16 family)
LCIPGKQEEPLLKNIRTGLIDPDTPKEAMTRISANGEKQVLVFSDEFNIDGRSFYDGDDPYFQAVDIWYGATMDLEVGFVELLGVPMALTFSSGTTPIRPSPKTVL